MSFSPLPAEEDYWKSGDKVWGNRFIRKTMSREAYHEVKKCLVIRVDELVAHLTKKYREMWEPYYRVVVDESLIPTKARCKIRVVIPRKPHPVGVKLWSLVDEAGFLYACSLFQRVRETTSDTLLRLVGYLPEGREFLIRADSYFGSIDGAIRLDEQGHFFTLACRKDRPSALFGRHLHAKTTGPNSTSSIFRNKTETTRVMAAITFRHHKTDGDQLVNFISNQFAGKKTVTKKNGAIPDVADDYNKHMGYVDQVDSVCLQYEYRHRLINWKHVLFFWLLETTMHNSWIIWNHLHPQENEDY